VREVSDSPIEQLLKAMDELNMDAAMALMAPDVRFLAVDGRRGEGKEAVRKLITDFISTLRSTSHRITAQWHEDDVWIAEVEGSYELRDYLQLNALPRAFVVRVGTEGIADFRAYGAHEQPLTEHRTGEEGMWVGGRWVPPL
jgi:SnoaL-like domain